MRAPLPPVVPRPARGPQIVRRTRQALTLLIGVILLVAGVSETGGRDAIVLTMVGLVVTAYTLVSLTEE